MWSVPENEFHWFRFISHPRKSESIWIHKNKIIFYAILFFSSLISNNNKEVKEGIRMESQWTNMNIKRAENILFIEKVLRFVSINSSCVQMLIRFQSINVRGKKLRLFLRFLCTCTLAESTLPIYFIIKRLEKLLHYFSVMWIF